MTKDKQYYTKKNAEEIVYRRNIDCVEAKTYDDLIQAVMYSGFGYNGGILKLSNEDIERMKEGNVMVVKNDETVVYIVIESNNNNEQ